MWSVSRVGPGTDPIVVCVLTGSDQRAGHFDTGGAAALSL